MRVRRIVLAAALGSSMLCPLRVHALDAHTVITRCAATAAAHPRGLVALRTACPDIDQAVASLKVLTLLPADWDKKASPASLAELDALAERYAGHPSSMLPAASDLRAIAQTLEEPSPPRSLSSRWDRIKAWLRRRLAPVAGLFKWVRSVPGWNAGPNTRWVLLATASLIILLGLGAFIISGLRAADLVGAHRRRPVDTKRRAARPRIGTGDAEVEDGIDQAGALDRPALALRILIDALRRSRRIERDGSLTCREVLAHAVFDTPGQREGFARIALLAEQQLFGPGGSSLQVPDELRPALLALHTQLLAGPVARMAAS